MKEDPKRPEEHSFAMNKHKIQKVVRRGRCLVDQRNERQERLVKSNDDFQNCGFRPCQADKGAGKDYTQNKGKDQKGKEELILNPDQQLLKHSMKKCGNRTIGLPAISLTRLGLQLLGGFVRKLTLHGMVATPLNIANHPTHVVLDLGCTAVDWIKSGNRKIQEACMV